MEKLFAYSFENRKLLQLLQCFGYCFGYYDKQRQFPDDIFDKFNWVICCLIKFSCTVSPTDSTQTNQLHQARKAIIKKKNRKSERSYYKNKEKKTHIQLGTVELFS